MGKAGQRLVVGAAFVLLFCLASCAHPNRVSRRTLDRLARMHEPFVLVFGSVSTPKGVLTRPEIRFVHQADRKAPEHLLWSLVVSNGDRFYAVLRTPEGLPYLDEFYTQVGTASTGFDKVLYVRLHKGDAPLAMYVGEIEVAPAQNRTAQGQTTAVNIRDEYASAATELKRLYPHFAGAIAKAPLLRDPVPVAAPTQRVR